VDHHGTQARRAVGSSRAVGTVVNSLGVQVDDDGLRIDEHRYQIKEPTIDVGEPLHQPDIAMALADLAADPASEALCDRVLTRLAVAHGWFLNPPSLSVTSALIAGRGVGAVLDGVFIWRAQGTQQAFTYIVTPDLYAKELLKSQPALTRALIRVACPRPEDVHSELGERLQLALSRLGAVLGTERELRREFPAVTAVLEVKDAEVERERELPAVAGTSVGREPDPADRALSEELAQLARKVGTRAARPTGVEGASS
jgi:hypothetical protein